MWLVWHFRDISRAHILVIKWRQFHKNCDAQAGADLTYILYGIFCVLRRLLTAIQVSLYFLHRVGAGGCLHQYNSSPYCIHRVGTGGCLQQCGFSPYCTYRVGAGGCLQLRSFSLYIYIYIYIIYIYIYCLGAGEYVQQRNCFHHIVYIYIYIELAQGILRII